jgi:iron complex transport system substrate-binding protein
MSPRHGRAGASRAAEPAAAAVTAAAVAIGAVAVALAITAAAAASTATPAAAADAAGAETAAAVAVPAAQPTEVRRIVSLAPHLTELLFAAGAGDRIVGVGAFSDHPPAAIAIERIGDSHALDLERIVALRPDLVVAWAGGTPARQLEPLRRLGLRIHLEAAVRLDDIGDAIERLGALAGTAEAAAEAAARYRDRLASLRARHASRQPVRVFHQVWDVPLMTINGDHPISDLIAACGGRNVFADASTLVPHVSREAVVRAAPAVISAAAPADGGDAFAGWRHWRAIPAVANGRLVALPADAVSRLSPRLLDAAAPLCEALDAARR